VDLADGIQDPKGQVVGQFTFFGREGVSLIGKDEALLVPDPLNPPVIVPSPVLEPVGRKYTIYS
jgi:hypothetical protein